MLCLDKVHDSEEELGQARVEVALTVTQEAGGGRRELRTILGASSLDKVVKTFFVEGNTLTHLLLHPATVQGVTGGDGVLGPL